MAIKGGFLADKFRYTGNLVQSLFSSTINNLSKESNLRY